MLNPQWGNGLKLLLLTFLLCFVFLFFAGHVQWENKSWIIGEEYLLNMMKIELILRTSWCGGGSIMIWSSFFASASGLFAFKSSAQTCCSFNAEPFKLIEFIAAKRGLISYYHKRITYFFPFAEWFRSTKTWKNYNCEWFIGFSTLRSSIIVIHMKMRTHFMAS